MSSSARLKPPVPFIADHRLIALLKQSDEATLEEQKAWLQPDTFRWRRTSKKELESQSQQEIRPAFDLSVHWVWKPLRRDRRAKFLTDLKRRRIVITDNAGCGKSVAAEQMQYLLHQMCPGHLCLLVNFAELPQRVDEFRGNTVETSKLIEWFRNTQATADADVQSVAKLIDHKILTQQLTLIVDAFDQTTADKNTSDQAMALRNFLKRYPGIRCVCTGRPHAIVDQFWKSLFSHEEWLFVQIDVFSETQARTFVGKDRWDLCQRLEATELVVPRSLEAIRRIPTAQLSNLRTASQVYWRSLLHTLEEARVMQDDRQFRSPDGSWSLEKPDALQLFALLGFECNRQGYLNGVRTGQEFRNFLDSLWNRHAEHLKDELGISSKRAFRQILDTLARLNVALDFAALDHAGISQIIFQNRTLQDFFAALWMCNSASEADRQWFSDQRFVRWKKDSETHYQFWKLTAEMPNEPQGNLFSRTDKYYARAMAPLYAASTGERPAIRATEMIWRSWETMVLLSRQPGEAGSIVRHALDNFRLEYQQIRAGSRGAEARRICEDFESWFVDIDPRAADWSAEERDVDGASLPIVNRRYEIAKYTLTNELFELFDQNLRNRYVARGTEWKVDFSQYLLRPRVPVVAIDWYDGWCVAQWLLSELPTDQEWEYACRAGERRRYSVGDGTTLQKTDARFDESWQALAIEVDAFEKGNAWGLYQMHGNVWEWCHDWYDADESSRCLRGGSFYYGSGSCRSAFRGRDGPAGSDSNFGVRLSRAASD